MAAEGFRVGGDGGGKVAYRWREQTWDTTGAPGAAVTLVGAGCAGWEVGWVGPWGATTTGVCCGVVTATVGAMGPFWKSKEETER